MSSANWGQQPLALPVREQRSVAVTAAAQLVDQRLADLAPDPWGREGAEPGAAADDRAQQRGPPAGLDEVARVVVGDARHVPLVDAEEAAGAVDGRLRLVDRSSR